MILLRLDSRGAGARMFACWAECWFGRWARRLGGKEGVGVVSLKEAAEPLVDVFSVAVPREEGKTFIVGIVGKPQFKGGDRN